MEDGSRIGLLAGLSVAIGGALKDAPYEGFKGHTFLRSPAIGMLVGAFIEKKFGINTPAALFLSTIGGERIVVETWKLLRNKKPGKFIVGEWGVPKQQLKEISGMIKELRDERIEFAEGKIVAINCSNFAENNSTNLIGLTEKRRQTWREGMAISQKCMSVKGISCRDPNYQGSLEDCEVADIGANYTWHTHPCGEVRPSPADIATTRKLKKQFLCIGVGMDKTICYDANTLQKVKEIH